MNILKRTKLTAGIERIHVDKNIFKTANFVIEMNTNNDASLNEFVSIDYNMLSFTKIVDGEHILLDKVDLVTGDNVTKVYVYRINEQNVFVRYSTPTTVYHKTFTIFDNKFIVTYGKVEAVGGDDEYVDEIQTLTFRENNLRKHILYNKEVELVNEGIVNLNVDATTTDIDIVSINQNIAIVILTNASNTTVIEKDKKVDLDTNSSLVIGLDNAYILTENNNEVAINNT